MKFQNFQSNFDYFQPKSLSTSKFIHSHLKYFPLHAFNNLKFQSIEIKPFVLFTTKWQLTLIYLCVCGDKGKIKKKKKEKRWDFLFYVFAVNTKTCLSDDRERKKEKEEEKSNCHENLFDTNRIRNIFDFISRWCELNVNINDFVICQHLVHSYKLFILPFFSLIGDERALTGESSSYVHEILSRDSFKTFKVHLLVTLHAN